MSRMRGPFFALLLISSRLLAQETTGTLQGTVTDPSGAVSPGVSIVATNLATNVSREAKSDASGLYSIPSRRRIQRHCNAARLQGAEGRAYGAAGAAGRTHRLSDGRREGERKH
jgi:hypothetical protein